MPGFSWLCWWFWKLVSSSSPVQCRSPSSRPHVTVRPAAEEVDVMLQRCEGGVDAALQYAKNISKYMKDLIGYLEKRTTLGEAGRMAGGIATAGLSAPGQHWDGSLPSKATRTRLREPELLDLDLEMGLQRVVGGCLLLQEAGACSLLQELLWCGLWSGTSHFSPLGRDLPMLPCLQMQRLIAGEGESCRHCEDKKNFIPEALDRCLEPNQQGNPCVSSLFTSNLFLPEMEFAKGLQKMANSCKQTITQEVSPRPGLPRAPPPNAAPGDTSLLRAAVLRLRAVHFLLSQTSMPFLSIYLLALEQDMEYGTSVLQTVNTLQHQTFLQVRG